MNPSPSIFFQKNCEQYTFTSSFTHTHSTLRVLFVRLISFTIDCWSGGNWPAVGGYSQTPKQPVVVKPNELQYFPFSDFKPVTGGKWPFTYEGDACDPKPPAKNSMTDVVKDMRLIMLAEGILI